MKQIEFIIALIFVAQTLGAQKTVVNKFSDTDKKSLELPDSLAKTTRNISTYITSNFKTDRERVRAIFIWVATNLQYDIDNMFAINFYESQEKKITKALDTRKGICENYAALFNDICLHCGIKSFVVEGYTKQNGFTDHIPHAWCAALIDSTWTMFDPTWGSGYINNGKFYKKIDNAYFDVNPSILIRSHMPFDLLWQFLPYPITSQEFYEGKTTQNSSKSFFNFSDSIQNYEHQTRTEQLIGAANRIEKNGVKNSMVFDRLQHIKLELENDKIRVDNERRNEMANLYNTAVADYNYAISDLNEFIDYRNYRFIPTKPDAEIQGMIDSVNTRLIAATTKLNQIRDPETNLEPLISQLAKSIAEIDIHAKEQQDWLKLYFSKSQSKRKSMFYEKKITWFGIPIN